MPAPPQLPQNAADIHSLAVPIGYLFATKSGRTLQQRNVLRALHATGKKVGLHAFRRFRTETLRRARVPEDLTKLWLGHSKQTVTDFYAIGLQKKTRCGGGNGASALGWGFLWLGYLGYKMKWEAIRQKQHNPNEGQRLEWRAQGDDFRTFLGEFVTAVTRIELPAAIGL
jgi:hypothetical protein